MDADKLIIGYGYLGTRVGARWQQEGARVAATTRSDARAAELQRQGIAPVLCDVCEPATLASLPAAATTLYAIGLDRTAGRSMREVYVDGLRQTLQRLPNTGKFIYVSSSSVYGQRDGGWVNETSPTEPEEDSGRVVLEAEGVLRELRPDAVILRFGGIYGPGRWLRRQAIEKGEPIVGDSSKWLNLIHVDDGAAAILAAERCAGPGQIYNVCDGQPVRRADFYAEVARRLGAPAPTFVLPPADHPTPPHERANRRISNARLRDELHFQPAHASYREGLAT